MTTAAQVNALIDAHQTRDDQRFRVISLQIAASMKPDARAAILRRFETVRLPLPEEMKGLLRPILSQASLVEMVLNEETRVMIDRVLREFHREADLAAKGLSPARKLLFTGPPGCGKTMTASALAHDLNIPIYRVEIHGVVSSYMGDTSRKLASIFDFIAQERAVYLFDEADALAGARDPSDGSAAGAETRRIVNSLLQFIEDDGSKSLIIATTNHAQIFDRAMFRRFDAMVPFLPPAGHLELDRLVTNTLGTDLAIQLDVAKLFDTAVGIGHADLVAAMRRVLKDHILDGTAVSVPVLERAIRERPRA